MQRIYRIGVLGSVFLGMLAALVAVQGGPPSLAHDATLGAGCTSALDDLGFELAPDPGDGHPECWNATSEGDDISVVGTEGPGDFLTYTDLNATIVPLRGEQMLRMGLPANVNEQQTDVANSVAQPFTDHEGPIEFSFRLLSWEHRGNDLLRFHVSGYDGAEVTLTHLFEQPAWSDGDSPIPGTFAPPATGTCFLPCEFTLDVGKRGDFLDTNWIQASIDLDGVAQGPHDGTLEYLVSGTNNNAHATWGYFDSINTRPEAKFTLQFSEGNVGTNAGEAFLNGPLEGSVVQAVDLSTDPDGPGDIVSRVYRLGVGAAECDIASGTVLPGQGELINSPNPNFIPRDEGPHCVELTVTDAGGLSDTAAHPVLNLIGQVPAEQPLTSWTVLNALPLVNALNQQKIYDAAADPGGISVDLFGRFSDAGYEDTHTADFRLGPWPEPPLAFPPVAVTGAVQEQNTPALASGVVTATLHNVNADTTLTLTVDDGEGDPTGDLNDLVGADEFVIDLIDAQPLLDETTPDGTAATAPPKEADWIYQGFIDEPGDVDFSQVLWPGINPLVADGQALQPGTEVLVTLTDLQFDADLIVLAKVPGVDFQTAGFQLGGFQLGGFQLGGYELGGFQLGGTTSAGFQLGGFQLGGFQLGGFQLGGFQLGGFQLGGFQLGGFQLGGFQLGEISLGGFQLGGFQLGDFGAFGFNPFFYNGLSQLAYTGLEGNDVSSSDIDIAELALGGTPAGYSIVGFSANAGTADEVVSVSVDVAGTEIVVAVVGANGAFSPTDPYALQIEASMPIESAFTADLTSNAGMYWASVTTTGSCAGSTPIGISNTVQELRNVPDADTLFVTQEERLHHFYDGADPSGVADLLADLNTLAARPEVNGDIISLAASTYNQWDASPCSVDEANGVADAVHAAIQAQMSDNGSDYEFIVIVGNDNIVPMRRVTDDTTIGNEAGYLLESFLQPGTPLFASVQSGSVLTDDFYADDVPTAWLGRSLYLPDRAIGRLVETPEEMEAQIDAYILSDGILDTTTATVTGYDFFEDGADAAADALDAGLSGEVNRDLIDPPSVPPVSQWTAQDLINEVFALAPASRDVNVVNAHYTSYAALSAFGFATNDFTDIVTSADAAAAGGGGQLAGTIYFTIGCHAGFNVPDGDTQAVDPGTLGFDPALDFAQAMAIQRAIFVASTGYGLGDDEGVAGTEELLIDYADALVASNGVAAGTALLNAKLDYWTSQLSPTVYDEKSLIQLTFYGLPMYAVQTGAPLAPSSAAPELSVSHLHDQALNLVINDPLGPTPLINSVHTLHRIVGENGIYYAADGGDNGPEDVQATAFRAIEPRVVLDVTPLAPAPPVRGLMLESASFSQVASDGSTVLDGSLNLFDPSIVRPVIEWEGAIAEPNVCLSAFFPSEIARVNEFAGTQKLVVIPGQFRCDSAGGSVTGTQILYTGLEVTLLRSDSADVQAPLVNSVELLPVGTDLQITVDVSDIPDPGGSGVVEVRILQNTGTSLFVPAGGSSVFAPEQSTTVVLTIPDPGDDSLMLIARDAANNVTTLTNKGAGGFNLIDVDARISSISGREVTFEADVVGEPNAEISYVWTFEPGDSETGVFTLDGNGEGTAPAVVHTFSESEDFFIVKLKVTDAFGGVGVDLVSVLLCSDPIDAANPDGDIVACGMTSDGTELTVTMTVDGDIDTGQAKPDVQYRVYLDLGVFEGGVLTDPTPDGNTDFQVKYLRGKVTGDIDAASAEVSGDTLIFTIDVAETGRTATGEFAWSIETQSGEPGEPGAGFLDLVPDLGLLPFVFD